MSEKSLLEFILALDPNIHHLNGSEAGWCKVKEKNEPPIDPLFLSTPMTEGIKNEQDEVDSNKVLQWINDITRVHDQIVKGEMFSAGFHLCLLQQCLEDVSSDLEVKKRKAILKKILNRS